MRRVETVTNWRTDDMITQTLAERVFVVAFVSGEGQQVARRNAGDLRPNRCIMLPFCRRLDVKTVLVNQSPRPSPSLSESDDLTTFRSGRMDWFVRSAFHRLRRGQRGGSCCAFRRSNCRHTHILNRSNTLHSVDGLGSSPGSNSKMSQTALIKDIRSTTSRYVWLSSSRM